MNKVTSYLKNVGKSVAYATIDMSTKKLIPEVAEFTDTNKELFKAVYATSANFKRSVRKGTMLAKQTQIYKDINTGINNALEDIKTGNFYNKERSDAAIDAAGEALAGGYDDFGNDFDFDFSDWDTDDGSLDDFSDNSESKSVTKGDMVVADSVVKSGNLSAQLISKTVASTSSNIIKTSMTTTNMMMAHTMELANGIRTSIAGVHESINSILRFSQEAIVPHFNTQAQYFTDSMNVMRENNAILKEMLEMQRNVYNDKVQKSKIKDDFGNVFSGGTLDLTEYAKTIWKNAKNLDKTGSANMLFSDMGGSTMLGHMLSNPIGFAVTNVIERFIPKTFAQQVASFSKTLGNMFPVMITRLNKWKKDDRGGILGFLGNLFGLDVTTKRDIDTSKYNKGAVPFDGITRKAIVDVIPEHLSKIESLLSGSSQRTYDFETGKWMTAKDIKKKKNDEYENVVKSSFNELNDDIKTFIQTLESQKALDAKTKRSLEEDIYKMMKNFFEGEEIFSPEQIKKKAKESGYTNDALMEQFGEMLSNVPVSKLSSVYANVFDNKRKYSEKMADSEAKGYDVIRKLFDNSNIDSHLIYDKNFTNEIIGNKAGLNLLNIKDKHGMNTLDYLKQILINVSYIREFGGTAGGSGRRKKANFESYSGKFDKSYTPENIAKLEESQNASDKRYDELNYNENISTEEAAAIAAFNIKRKSKFSDLDDEEFSNFGKWYKDKNKYMKEMEEIPGDTFVQKWSNAQSMKQKQMLIMGSISEIARKPASALTGMIATAEKSIYNFLFQAETDELDDETGKKIKGFFPAMLNKMRAKWDELTTSIDEKFITPLVQKYGLDEKWQNLKDKVKNSKPMDMLRNAKNNVKDALFKDFKGIGNYVKDSVSDVAAPVIYDKNFIKARTDAIKNRYKKANEKDIESLRNDLAGYSEEDIKYLKEHASPDLLKMIEQAGFAEGGTGIVEKGGSIQVSEGEVVNVQSAGDPKKNREKELANSLAQMEALVRGRTNRTKATFAKVRRLNEKARETNSTVVSDTLSKGVEELKNEVVDPIKSAVNNYLGIKGETPEEQEKNIKKEKNKILSTVTNIFSEMKGEGASTISKSLIGGGIGLLSGVIGGPLIGAGIGAATSLIKNSETVNKAIFGEDIEDEEGNVTHKGGIISKKVQDTFKKYIPDIGKYGVTGAVASLLTPFGPLAGAAIGAGVGFIKNSQTMNEMIFGKEITNEDGTKSKQGGLLTEERLGKIKKFLPKAAVGALGSMVLGPFGILGNAALGAGIGMLTGTEEFKELILGRDDGDGNRIGGIKGALQEHFIEPLKNFGRNFKEDFFGFIKESMIDPLNDAITPIASEIAFQTKRVVFGIPKWFLNLGKDYIAVPIMTKLQDTVFEPIAKGIKGLFGNMFSRFKGIISAPFRALGAVGNATRKHQIKQGRDAGSAKDRLAFANKQKIGDYKYREFDEKLAENADDTEYLQELTARTGMLAHGSEYFDNQIKSTRKELSKVVSDYYKLGWFSKDKKSYNRIRKYIHDNDIEAAINELTNIKESRVNGGKLDDEASGAIARFTSANKKYQAVRDAKEKFGDINESENAEWMDKNFGQNWRDLNAERLFDYSRKELSRAGGKNIAKADLFKNPAALVTEGDKQINATLNKILNVITHGKEGTFVNEEDSIEYDKRAKAGAAIANAKISIKKDNLKKKLAKFAFTDATISILYKNKDLENLVLSAKSQGFTYDDETVSKLQSMGLKRNQYNLLKSFPGVAFEKKEDILKALDYTRNNKATIFNNRLFGAKKVRNQNLGMMNIAGRDIEGIKSGGIKPLSKEQLQSQDINPDDKYTYINTNYGIRRYYKDGDDMTLDMSDAETKQSLQAEQEDHNIKKSFMGSITGIKDSVLGMFDRNKEKDEEEKKEPWYKKLFNGEIGSKVKFGAAILGLVTGIGAIKNLWDNSKENNGVVYRIGSSVANAVAPFFTKIHNWFTNEGEYSDTENTGLAGFLNTRILPNLFKGMNVIFGTILPTAVTVFIKNIPNLIKGALKGVASLFGWWNKDNNKDASFDKNSATAGGGKAITANISGNGSWLSEVLSDATNTASTMSNITVNDSGTISTSETTQKTEEDSRSKQLKNSRSKNLANGVLANSSTEVANSNELMDKIDGIGTVYVKDKKTGELHPATVGEYNNAKDIYNKDGRHWIYNEETGQFDADESEFSDKSTVGGSMAKRLGYGAARGFLTGRESGIAKLGKRMSAKPRFKGVLGMGETAIRGTAKAFGAASSLGAYARESLETAPTNVTSKVAKAGESQNKKLKEKIIAKGKELLEKLFKNKRASKKISEAAAGVATNKKGIGDIVTKLIDDIMIMVAKVLNKAGATKIGKIAAKVVSRKVFTVAFLVSDFIAGCDQAESILKIKEPNAVQTLIAGLSNVIVNFIFAGFISTGFIIEKLVNIVFPIFKIDVKKYKKQKAEADEETKAYNKANADNLSTEQYLKENYSVTGKAGKWFKNLFKKKDKKEKPTSGKVLDKAAQNKIKVNSDIIKNPDITRPDDVMTATNANLGISQAAQYEQLSSNIDKANTIMDLKLGRQFGFKSSNGKYIGLTEGVNKFKYSDLDKMNAFTLDDAMNINSQGLSNLALNSSSSTNSSSSSSKTSFLSKAGSAVKNAWGKFKGLFSGSGTGSDSGFVSQIDPKYKNKKFNISGDTEYQTLGDSGCAPATASNVLNLYSGSGSLMDNASKAALKYKDKNGGVTPDYFNDYLGRNGVGTYSTTNKQELLSGIQSGKPTVLLGTDPTNKANTPYGASSSHYVLATGLDGKGNVIIQDPESKRPNALYPVDDVIKQSQMGIVTARRNGKGTNSRSITNQIRPKLGKIGFGRGSNTKHQDLGKWSPLSDAEIDKFIKNSNSKSPFTGAAINKAAKASGLDPRYILAHAAVESAWGTSEYGRKDHNYFGIGAFDSNPDNAKNYGNSGMVDGLVNGAVWIRKNYYDKGQKTIYTMRYNGGKHQYCTSTTWVDTIASIMDRMPANKNATYHEAGNTEDTGDPSSNQTASLFSKISDAMLSYYDKDLINLLWGESTSDESGDVSGASGSAQKVIEIAKKEVGTKADGTKHQKYGKAYGMDGVDWCAIFCWWVFNEAGCSSAFYGGKKSAYCPTILDYYKGKKQTVSIKNGQPGDLIFFNWDGGSTPQHIGIIESKTSSGYMTIEGNTGYSSGSPGGEVKRQERTKSICAIARPKYEQSSGEGTSFNSYKTNNYLDDNLVEIRRTKSKNVAAAAMNTLSGKGTNKKKYLVDRFKDPDTNTSELSSNGIFDRSIRRTYINPTDAFVGTNVSGKGTGFTAVYGNTGFKTASTYSSTSSTGFTSLPSLNSSTNTRTLSGIESASTGYNITNTTNGSTSQLLNVIIDILRIIANNSEKLSEIVILLSKALNLELTNDDITKLSSNNAKIKNKISNALKAQGSVNGLGNSMMNSSTESLAAAMYSIARS